MDDNMREMKERFRPYGLSQQQIGECVGLNAPLVSQIFSGKVMPSSETEYRLKRLLAMCDAIRKMVLKRLQK